MSRKLLVVQYAGDFREAYLNREKGRGANYYAQMYSLDVVCEQADVFDEVATLCCVSDTPHNQMLCSKVRSISVSGKTGFNLPEVLRHIENFKPTHLILRTPNLHILKYALKKKMSVFLTLADSFFGPGLRRAFFNFRLRRMLNHPSIDWIANHGWTASNDLTKIGINATKVLPWDWPHSISPSQYPAKSLPQKHVYRLIFVGHVSHSKGLGDSIEAVKHLKQAGIHAVLSVYGKGDIGEFQQLAHSIGVEDQIEFKGMVANSEIIPNMASADFVLIPSRHDYPEGFPMTIYEALCSRTVIVASDHPMFSKFLIHKKSALIYPAGNSLQLSQRIAGCIEDPAQYESLSKAADITWNEIQVPFLWGDLIHNWCHQSPQDFRAWVDEKDAETGFRRKIANL
jgi:glycosyltransferase involved in cell wall biosynthesis